jgi:hypothetical protein
MADFAVWASAVEPAFGWRRGDFSQLTNATARMRARSRSTRRSWPEVQKLGLPCEGTAEDLLQKLAD